MLLAGAVLFWVTIGFELWIGWTTGKETPLADVAALLLGHWAALRWIRAAQMLALLLVDSPPADPFSVAPRDRFPR